MLMTLLACHLFLHLTKLLAALFQLECAGSLSCSDHVSGGEHWGVRTLWRQVQASGVGSGQTGTTGVGGLVVQEYRALLIGVLCI